MGTCFTTTSRMFQGRQRLMAILLVLLNCHHAAVQEHTSLFLDAFIVDAPTSSLTRRTTSLAHRYTHHSLASLPPSSSHCYTTSPTTLMMRSSSLTPGNLWRRLRLRAVSISSSSSTTMSRSVDDEDQQNDDDDDDVIDLTVLDEDDIDFLFEDDDEDNEQSQKELEPSEKLWRYIKKPLLRIGAKGATHSHGNSLRQLLEDHTAVKVKMNTKKYNGSLQEAAQALKDLAIENAAPVDIEIIQLRESEKTVLYGSPGTRQQCEDGMFPPPPLTPPEDDVDNNNENGDGTV